MTAVARRLPPIADIVVPADRGKRPNDYYGDEIELNGPIWKLNDPDKDRLAIDWKRLGIRHRGLVEATADFMVDLILSTSASNAANHFDRICAVTKLRAFRLWNEAPLPHFRGELTHTWFYEARDSGSWSKSQLSYALRWFMFCAKREDSGIAEFAARTLGAITIGGGPKAVAVLKLDPKSGPLDDAETTALLQAVAAARATKSIPLKGLAAVWLCIILGPNPRQLSLLREEDFRRIDGAHPELSIPRIKGKDARIRQQFRQRKLDEVAASLIEELIAENAARRLAEPWTDEQFGRALFFRDSHRKNLLGRPRHEYAMHATSIEMGRLVEKTVMSLEVHSPRTGKTLAAGPRRFRYTFATRLLREGASPNVIADLLDHSDLQTVRHYLNLRGDIVDKLDAAMAMDLAPIAQAFLGTLVASEGEALQGTTRTSRIFAATNDPTDEAVGTCGSLSFCGLAAPRACYTCVKFQPWIDGPHDAVLRTLLSDREERRARGLNGRIVSMNDNTILAVADVIRRCEEAKGTVPQITSLASDGIDGFMEQS